VARGGRKNCWNGGCRLRLPWWPEVVRRFALAVYDGSIGGEKDGGT